MKVKIIKNGNFIVGGLFKYKGLIYKIDSFPELNTVCGHIDKHADAVTNVIRVAISEIKEA